MIIFQQFRLCVIHFIIFCTYPTYNHIGIFNIIILSKPTPGFIIIIDIKSIVFTQVRTDGPLRWDVVGKLSMLQALLHSQPLVGVPTHHHVH